MARPQYWMPVFTDAADRDLGVSANGLLAATAIVAHGALPAAVILTGLVLLGAEAISWPGAILAGVLATLALTLVTFASRALHFEGLDVLDLLGNVLASVYGPASGVTIAMLHVAAGTFFAIAWVYGNALAHWPAHWTTGLLWGFVLWGLAFILRAVASSVHYGIQDPSDSSTKATTGAAAPLVSLAGHLVYGLVLGLVYAGATPLF